MTLRIYCPYCSAEIRNDSGICSTCGVTMGELDPDATRRFDPDKSPRRASTSKTTSYGLDRQRALCSRRNPRWQK